MTATTHDAASGGDARTGAPPPLPLEGQAAIVTGGGQGIGRAFAHALANAGSAVAVADVDERAARSVAAELAGLGNGSLAIQVDVTDEEAVAIALRRVLDEFGRIDTLINNAAVFSSLTMKPFEEIAADEWRRVLDVNLTGMFLTTRAVAPVMRAQRRGSIINVSSGTVLNGRPLYLHYVTSKAGVIGMTRSLARELGTHGVTVNSILPGSVDTGIERASAPPGPNEGILAAQSLKWRLGPDDITGTAVFLASDAARAMTGQSLVLDAGSSFV
ncbi:SDR family NAD(P)-dependent oxidoreductase [Georgenia sp. Z1491]|uniref:SDR family NAD(P)-dependent oxidoreductase n=1 Tax=Georgenia sp. Z1491 TaxID=3416707 RepID=UPI003CEA190C